MKGKVEKQNKFVYTQLNEQFKGWRMVNARLCETARPVFSLRDRDLLWSLYCKTEIQTPHWLCKKKKKNETARRSEPRKKRDCETREI